MDDLELLKSASRNLGARYKSALAELADAWSMLYSSESYGLPRPKSQVIADAEALRQSGGDLHQEDPGRAMGETILSRMLAASDHLRATGHVMAADDCGFFATWVTERASLEQLAIAYWLSEPGIGPRERFGRMINDRLWSIRGGKRLVERIVRGVAAEYGDVTQKSIPPDLQRMIPLSLELAQELSEVQDQAEALGYRMTGNGQEIEPGQPTLTALVDALIVPGTYSLSSGMAHVELWTTGYLREQMRFQGSRPVSGELGPLTYEMVHNQSLALVLLTSWGRVVRRVTDFFGWDDSLYAEAHNRAAAEITKVIRVHDELGG